MHPIPRTRRNALAGLLLAAVVAVPLVASARHGEGRRGPPTEQERERFHGKMKQRMAKVLRERVGLDEARAKQVEAIFERRRQQGRALHEQLRTHREALRKLLEADSSDQAAYQRALDGLQAAHKALRAHREQGIAEARRVLTPKEQAKLLRAMHRMGKHRFGPHGRGGPHGRSGPQGDDDGPDGPPPGADLDDDA